MLKNKHCCLLTSFLTKQKCKHYKIVGDILSLLYWDYCHCAYLVYFFCDKQKKLYLFLTVLNDSLKMVMITLVLIVGVVLGFSILSPKSFLVFVFTAFLLLFVVLLYCYTDTLEHKMWIELNSDKDDIF